MKKTAAILLALILCFVQVGALASTPVDTRFWGQAKQSGLKGTITFDVSGDGTRLMDEETFGRLKAALPRHEISFGHYTYAKKYPGGFLSFPTADGGEGEIQFVYNDKLLALSGNAVSDDESWYLTETDLGRVAALLMEPDESGVPGVEEILSAIQGADAAWHERARECLAPYETTVSIWMNQYAGTKTSSENGVLYSELKCTIPAEAVKAEIKTLLQMLYGDAQALQLLEEVLGPIGGSIYLNPLMEGAFGMLVDQMELQGDVTVVRRFDARGSLILDSITLPLPPTEKWQQISLEMTGSGDVHLNLKGHQGESIAFSAQATEKGYAGNVTVEYMKDEEKQHIGFDYEWTWQQMEETYSLQTDLLEMLQQGVLTLTPDEETALPAQRITIDVAYSCTSAGRGSPTTLKADILWMDMESNAALAVMLHCVTDAPREMKRVEELENVMYFADMPAQQRQALISHILMAPFQAVME